MTRLPRDGQRTLTDARSLRLRAAWLYYVHGLTQKDVADRLGLARTSVVKLLEEARQRGEVQIRIAEGAPELIDLGLRLEERLGLDEAIVVPSGDGAEGAAKAVGAALGAFLSDTISDGMRIGVGWGRTLTAALATFRPPRREGVQVLSLLGGVVEVAPASPPEFAWRLASELGAKCFLFPAPLIVDSAETRERLMGACGLDRLERMAESLDLAVVSVGDIGPSASSLSVGLITAAELGELRGLGCVADLMCNFLDAEGLSVPHPLNARVLSIPPETVARARHVVLATGGADRAEAILAARRRIGCHTLVTDEGAAARLLKLASR
jgi:DNA-binding transcriptional regulator LsrR (DeoR family)